VWAKWNFPTVWPLHLKKICASAAASKKLQCVRRWCGGLRSVAGKYQVARRTDADFCSSAERSTIAELHFGACASR
jgi:hypothetical protein